MHDLETSRNIFRRLVEQVVVAATMYYSSRNIAKNIPGINEDISEGKSSEPMTELNVERLLIESERT